MARWVMQGIAAKARINDGTSVAAWNSGGYCLTSKSVISQLPYLGTLSLEPDVLDDWICGV